MALEPNCQHAEYLRCSRPLCSSQNTGGTPCAWPLPKKHCASHNEVQRSVHSDLDTAVRPTRSPKWSGPSGPNSVQKTRLFAGIRSSSQGAYLVARFDPGHNVNVPPMSATGKQMFPK
jgi:hypothetical protein